MTFPLTTHQIVSWYRSKQAVLEGSGVSLVGIRESTGRKPAAAADFDADNAMGRINGWVSGEIDFEAVRVSDGKDLFWQHVDVSVTDQLDATYADFIQRLLSPEDPDSSA